MDIARQIYDMREQAGLTQAQLAKLMNVDKKVIIQLEDADYEDRPLEMLGAIMLALQKKYTINVTPKKRSRKSAAPSAAQPQASPS
jgi:DNA-binding XRE family transcriptional regulator